MLLWSVSFRFELLSFEGHRTKSFLGNWFGNGGVIIFILGSIFIWLLFPSFYLLNLFQQIKNFFWKTFLDFCISFVNFPFQKGFFFSYEILIIFFSWIEASWLCYGLGGENVYLKNVLLPKRKVLNSFFSKSIQINLKFT